MPKNHPKIHKIPHNTDSRDDDRVFGFLKRERDISIKAMSSDGKWRLGVIPPKKKLGWGGGDVEDLC